MKFLFIVQGEGRGHMIQAISLFKILEKNGHHVCHVLVGKSPRRTLPCLFLDNIKAPITQLDSPNFVTDRNNKSVKILKTLFVNLWKYRSFLKSIREIHQIVTDEKPDSIINFYDFLGGLYFLLKKPKCNHIALAHQFFLAHSTFTFPKGRLLERLFLLTGNQIAGYGAKKILGLSFQHVPDDPEKKLYVVPPLIREEIKRQRIALKDHFLVYIVNDGYSVEVERFHTKNPEIPIHCFWDKKGMPEVFQKDERLTFHQLNNTKFVQMMSNCKGFLTTAGFESVCEAMYMGKPVLMVPVKGHYEQSCNAEDAKKAGAGVCSDVFDLDILLDYLPKHQSVHNVFHEWCAKTDQLFLEHLVGTSN